METFGFTVLVFFAPFYISFTSLSLCLDLPMPVCTCVSGDIFKQMYKASNVYVLQEAVYLTKEPLMTKAIVA